MGRTAFFAARRITRSNFTKRKRCSVPIFRARVDAARKSARATSRNGPRRADREKFQRASQETRSPGPALTVKVDQVVSHPVSRSLAGCVRKSWIRRRNVEAAKVQSRLRRKKHFVSFERSKGLGWDCVAHFDCYAAGAREVVNGNENRQKKIGPKQNDKKKRLKK
jgi:hypothetical protein